MRRVATLALVSALAVTPTFAKAESTGAEARLEIMCVSIYEYAHEVMEARQVGVPMPIVIKIASDNKLMREIAVAAYEQPRWPTEDYATNSADDFANEWYLACIQEDGQ